MKGTNHNTDAHVPTRVPGEGGIELESAAGNMQLTPRQIPTLWQRQAPARKMRRHLGRRAKAATYKPGARAPVSGVYNVVDENGTYQELQITSHAGKPLPPPLGANAHCEYELAYRAVHLAPTDEPMPFPPEIHPPGERVPVSGIYDVVDDQGRYLFHQRALVEDSQIFPPLEDPLAKGYALAFAARHLAHGPDRP